MGKRRDIEAKDPATAHTPARASSTAPERPYCGCPCVELGEAFAELLQSKDSHQLGCCARLGIPWQTHMTWMRREPEPGSQLAAYQKLVLVALDDQRMRDLEDGQKDLDTSHPAKAGAQFNMFRFKHESRFKRFYEDDAKKIELAGKDGGPIETSSTVRYVVAVPPEESDDEG